MLYLIKRRIMSMSLVVVICFFLVACSSNPDSTEDNPLSDVAIFQNALVAAYAQIQSEDDYNLVIQIDRERQYGNQDYFRTDNYSFFNQGDIFAYGEDLQAFFQNIDGKIYAYYQGDSGFIQTLAYRDMKDWTNHSFLPTFQIDEITKIDNDNFSNFQFKVNANTFLEDNPCYAMYFLMTVYNTTLKENGTYDLSNTDFDVSIGIDKSSGALFNISFDTVDYLNERIDTDLDFDKDFVVADVDFLYNTNSYTHDLSLIDTYQVDDYPDYPLATEQNTFMVLNTPQSINSQFGVDADSLSFNATQFGTYHLEINQEYRCSLYLSDINGKFLGIYSMNPGYDVVLTQATYELRFIASMRGIYEVTITFIE